MNIDAQQLTTLVTVCMIIASTCTSAVPVIYAFSPWYRSRLGRAFMVQALAFSVALDFALLFRFWRPEDIRVLHVLVASVYISIAAATAGIAWLMIQLNHNIGRHNKENTDVYIDLNVAS